MASAAVIASHPAVDLFCYSQPDGKPVYAKCRGGIIVGGVPGNGRPMSLPCLSVRGNPPVSVPRLGGESGVESGKRRRMGRRQPQPAVPIHPTQRGSAPFFETEISSAVPGVLAERRLGTVRPYGFAKLCIGASNFNVPSWFSGCAELVQ